MRKVIAVVFAGGSGTRMGTAVPKQFLGVFGRPVIVYTLNEFQKHSEVHEIYVACKEEYMEYLEVLVERFSLSKVREIVPGGNTGQDSIYRALAAVRKNANGDDIVLLHDAVRPCIDERLISRNIACVRKHGSAVTCLPSVETPIVSMDGTCVDKFEIRNHCFRAQAPQCFFLEEILKAHEIIRKQNPDYENITDSCSLMHLVGKTVHMVLGDSWNIKLTTPMDLEIFKTYLKQKRNEKQEKPTPNVLFEVIDIIWERVNLKLIVHVEHEGFLRFYLEQKEERIPFSCKKITQWEYEIAANITVIQNDCFLENGRWKVIALASDSRFVCAVSYDVARKFADCARIFRYGRTYAYTVSFEIEQNEEDGDCLCIQSMFMKENPCWTKKYSGVDIWKHWKAWLEIQIYTFYYHWWNKIGNKGKNSILFMSQTKSYMGENLCCLDLRMKERGLDKVFRFTYCFCNLQEKRNRIRNRLFAIRKMAQNRFIILDDYAPILDKIKLDSHSKVIQMWHAGEGFKSVGYMRFGRDGSPHPVACCHRQYDYVFVNEKRLVDVYAETFGIRKNIIFPLGLPRMEKLLDVEEQNRSRECFFEKYPQMLRKKVILFAPTFRGSGQKTAYYDFRWLDLERIYDVCGEEWGFVIKLHPFTRNKIEIPQKYQSRIVYYDQEASVNVLMSSADLLITDYSSCFYEFLVFQKPILFYTPDRKAYECSRGVYREMEIWAPGIICDDFERLLYEIRCIQCSNQTSVKPVEKERETNLDTTNQIIDRLLAIYHKLYYN